MKDLSNMLSLAQKLNEQELEILSSKILQMLSGAKADDKNDFCAPTVCRRCESHKIQKYGKDKQGNQRYKCSACNTTFIATSYSVVSKSHQDISVWKKYIPLLLQGRSLVQCAEECGISVQTAFTWRHKILHALQSDQTNRVLGGVVEIDDMFFSVSYKGNHKKSKNFVMPRKAYERGTDNTGATGNMACVLCACERQGQSYAEVVGIGAANIPKLQYAFDKRLLNDTIALTDKAYGYKNYFSLTPIELIQLASHSDPKRINTPPQVLGSYHIQNVNNFHNRFRRHMRNYNGVATKYLNHYVNLFVWVENHKKIKDVDLEKELFNTLNANNSYTALDSIVSLPPVPRVA